MQTRRRQSSGINSKEYDVTGGTAGEDPSYYRMGFFYSGRKDLVLFTAKLEGQAACRIKALRAEGAGFARRTKAILPELYNLRQEK